MGDIWDYKLRKMEMAWELATRLIPKEKQGVGAWSGGDESFLKKSQETLQKAHDVIEAVFTEDKDAKPSAH